MQRIWKNAPEVTVPPDVLAACDGDQLVASILYRRGFTSAEQVRGLLDLNAYKPASPYSFADMEKAVARLLRAADTGEKVLIWGDFDADGQTSTTILYEAFCKLKMAVDFHIPVRETEGHGIKGKSLQLYLNNGTRLMVTCDTGISEKEAIRLAYEQGVDVIITDHHELPEELPQEALAILNPRLLPEGHALGTLPGCGVAFLLAQALLIAAGQPKCADQGVDLAAIGIVADVAELRGDARYLLQRGLLALHRNTRAGLVSLLQIIGLDAGDITEENLGFHIAPRLNALGRLADANLAVEFFTTQDLARAQFLAQQLDDLNSNRKMLTDQVLQGALAQIDQHPEWSADPVLVLSHQEWPGGVLGIVANGLVSRFDKPAILFQIGKDGLARGSARSVPGIHITRAIQTHKDMLLSSGGHPGAAGLSLQADRLDEFRQVLQHTIAEIAITAPSAGEMQIDAEINLSEATLSLARRINLMAPFGAGFPAPVFSAPLVKVVTSTPVGKLKDHLSIQLQDLNQTYSTIWWQGAGQTLPEDWFRLAFSLRISSYQGKEQSQIEWLDWTEIDPGLNLPDSPPQTEWIDWRGIPDWQERLTELRRGTQDICVFAEGEMKAQIKGVDRNELTRAEILVWASLPPGQEEMDAIIEKVKAHRHYLLGVSPKDNDTNQFLRRLLGVARYFAEQNQGEVSLARLAAATCERVSTVRIGLEYLEARGDIEINSIDSRILMFGLRNKDVRNDSWKIQQRLERNLEESKAYRRSFLTNQSVLDR